jgi:hypothetical protein
MQNFLMKTKGKIHLKFPFAKPKQKLLQNNHKKGECNMTKKRKEEIVSNSLENKLLLEFSITQQHKTKCPCKTPLDKGKQHRRASQDHNEKNFAKDHSSKPRLFFHSTYISLFIIIPDICPFTFTLSFFSFFFVEPTPILQPLSSIFNPRQKEEEEKEGIQYYIRYYCVLCSFIVYTSFYNFKQCLRSYKCT